jgi:hypothetical protein
MEHTWGHLAPRKSKIYRGHIAFLMAHASPRQLLVQLFIFIPIYRDIQMHAIFTGTYRCMLFCGSEAIVYCFGPRFLNVFRTSRMVVSLSNWAIARPFCVRSRSSMHCRLWL